MIAFSGHGMQCDGENFLMPVDASVGTLAAIQRTCVALNGWMRQLYAHLRVGTVLVCIDACRVIEPAMESAATGVGLSANVYSADRNRRRT